MLRGPVVVALGGNALAPEGKGTYAELKQNIKRSISFVPELLRKGIRTVIVSGSGPQVGALLLESELAKEKLPAMQSDRLSSQRPEQSDGRLFPGKLPYSDKPVPPGPPQR